MKGDKPVPVALGFRAGRGGSVVVGVALEVRKPLVILSTFLPTAAEGDRLALEPYHVAAQMARGQGGRASPQAVAAVAQGRQRQDQMAASNLKALAGLLAQKGFRPAVAALLINRAGWITDLLEHSLFAPEHPPVAEGLAVRDALRFALGQSGIETVEMDEKSLTDTACGALRLSAAALDTRLKDLGAGAGKPWRKEQKHACLAAWLAARTLQGLSPGGQVTTRR